MRPLQRSDGTPLAEMVARPNETNFQGGKKMKRWTHTWAALIVAGFLTVPAAAQTPQTTAAPTTTATATSDKATQGTPQEHLQKADAAVSSIPASAISGKAKSQFSELKKHLSSLQKIVSSE
ncbi:MAG: hypothetical protein ABIX28_22125, partial [Vicinamibacterales bacterium]